MKGSTYLWVLLVAVCGFAQEAVPTKGALEFQKTINAEYANRAESPLTDADFSTFKSLDFYPIATKYIVTATFKRTENEKVFQMKTTSTRTPDYVKYGELRFTLDGVAYQLNVYQNIELMKKEGYHDYLFLPFSDTTCGKESYIGGRYIDLRIPTSDTVTIDFNQAYNPYCAYNHRFSCPLVPMENNLNCAILAGVKKFHD